MAQLLNDDIVRQVKELFDKELDKPVEVLFFGQKDNCDYCDDTQKLVEEVTDISEKLTLTRYDLDENAEISQKYNVTMAPGLVLAARDNGDTHDFGIRYSGIPSGHEFSSLIHDLILVSGRDSGLSEKTRQALRELKKPVHLQVFVTPTWPYCPQAVVLAHKMALESPMIQAEMIEAMEFQELSARHGVSGVPQTTINDGAGTVVGAVPEDHLLEEILRSLG
jgi:glutaredoxin-like protein